MRRRKLGISVVVARHAVDLGDVLELDRVLFWLGGQKWDPTFLGSGHLEAM